VIRICFFDKQRSRTKNAFWDVNNKKWRKWCKFVLRFLFNNTSGLPVLTMVTKCPNQVYYVWLVDLQTIALNTGWKYYSLQMMIFVYVCSTFSVVDLKTRFEMWIIRNHINDVNLFLFSYLITLRLYLCSHWTPNAQNAYLIFDWSNYRLFLLNKGWKLETLQMVIFVHVSSTCRVAKLKTRYETWITRNVVNGVNLFHLSYLITLTTYLCSQWAPNVKFKYLVWLVDLHNFFAK
jgi:hypothetical protein